MKLFIIVVAQFFCVSIWFALNPVIPDIIEAFGYHEVTVSSITSMVQFGFISGTFLLAILNISDRFPTRSVFFFFAIIGSSLNALIGFIELPIEALMITRFLVGVSLAGVYPVGIKISAEYFGEKLGYALGFLVGALALGTSFPHLFAFIRESNALSWELVVYGTSILSIVGALMIRFGLPKATSEQKIVPFKWDAILLAFKNEPFRIAAWGYFVHMWELYAFWAFVPALVAIALGEPSSGISFLVIAVGATGCVTAGVFTKKYTPKRMAYIFLLLSSISGTFFYFMSEIGITALLLPILFIWGYSVIADSPMYSTVVAKTAPPDYKGSAITIVNCIGFGISILSIQLLGWGMQKFGLVSVLFILIPSFLFFGYQAIVNKE